MFHIIHKMIPTKKIIIVYKKIQKNIKDRKIFFKLDTKQVKCNKKYIGLHDNVYSKIQLGDKKVMTLGIDICRTGNH